MMPGGLRAHRCAQRRRDRRRRRRPTATSRATQPHMLAVAGLVPCAACGTMISLRVPDPARAMIGADHGHAGELAVRSGQRTQRHGAHAGDGLEHLLQLVQAGEKALAGAVRAERMARRELRQQRRGVARLGVVLHRAGAERIEVRVDREVQLRQPRVMAHDVELADLGQRWPRAPAQLPPGWRRPRPARLPAIARARRVPGANTRRSAFHAAAVMTASLRRPAPARSTSASARA